MSLQRFLRPLRPFLPKRLSALLPAQSQDRSEELITLSGFQKDYARVKLHDVIQEMRDRHILDPELIEAVETLHYGLTYDHPLKRKHLSLVFPTLPLDSTQSSPSSEDEMFRHLDPPK